MESSNAACLAIFGLKDPSSQRMCKIQGRSMQRLGSDVPTTMLSMKPANSSLPQRPSSGSSNQTSFAYSQYRSRRVRNDSNSIARRVLPSQYYAAISRKIQSRRPGKSSMLPTSLSSPPTAPARRSDSEAASCVQPYIRSIVSVCQSPFEDRLLLHHSMLPLLVSDLFARHSSTPVHILSNLSSIPSTLPSASCSTTRLTRLQSP
jgi:hypothetical protein